MFTIQRYSPLLQHTSEHMAVSRQVECILDVIFWFLSVIRTFLASDIGL